MYITEANFAWDSLHCCLYSYRINRSRSSISPRQSPMLCIVSDSMWLENVKTQFLVVRRVLMKAYSRVRENTKITVWF